MERPGLSLPASCLQCPEAAASQFRAEEVAAARRATPGSAAGHCQPRRPRFLPLRLPGREAAPAKRPSAKRLRVPQGHPAAFWISAQGIWQELRQRSGIAELGEPGDSGDLNRMNPDTGLGTVATSCYFFGGVWIFLGNCPACVFCPAGSVLPCGFGKMFFSQKCLSSAALPASRVTLPPALGSALAAFPQ